MKAYTLGLYEKSMPNSLSWREKMAAAKEAGYDCIEISIDETDAKLARLEMTKEERAELVALMYEMDMPIRTMCLSGHRKYPLGSADEATRNRGMEIMEKAIELADDLGIRIIQIAGYDVYYEESTEETVRLFEENLKKSVEMAAKKGVSLGFETMETEFLNTCEKGMRFVNMVDSIYLSMYPDTGNLTNAAKTYGTDVYEDLRLGQGHTVAVHLKETVPGVFREVPYGTGHVDFEGMIKTAWDMGVRKYTAEFWDVGKPDWKEDLTKNREFLCEFLDKM